MNVDTAEVYEEGDVVGIFPNRTTPNDKTYLDLLTPNNYKEAILAGVITRSYYIAANSQEGMVRFLLMTGFICCNYCNE